MSASHPEGWNLDQLLEHLFAEHGWQDEEEDEDLSYWEMSSPEERAAERRYDYDPEA